MLHLRFAAASVMLAERLTPVPRRMLAGVSGGADSVALLLLLLERQAQITAVHVNHGLRGEASDGDERFVRELCGKLGVPLVTFRLDAPADPGEDWARRERYACFRKAAEQTGIRAIALAHHREDQAETLLMHLLRGAGLTGLGAMARETEQDGLTIIRPLLDVSREELRAYLADVGQDWREDASNGEMRYLRNALRHGVMPQLERLAPGAAKRLAGTAAILREEEALLQRMAEDFLARQGSEAYLPLLALREQPAAMRRRILRTWWQRAAGETRQERSLSAAQTEALCALTEAPAGSRCNLPQGWHGQTGWTHMHLIAPAADSAMSETPLAACGMLHLEPGRGRTGDGRTAQAIPRSLADSLVVRTRRPGDWIRPFGSTGRQTLQDYLVNRRVDAPFRDRVPLVCRGSEVLLAGGVGAGDVPRVDNTEDSVLLCWTTAFPWHGEHKR